VADQKLGEHAITAMERASAGYFPSIDEAKAVAISIDAAVSLARQQANATAIGHLRQIGQQI
jgi:hypothetical protein